MRTLRFRKWIFHESRLIITRLGWDIQKRNNSSSLYLLFQSEAKVSPVSSVAYTQWVDPKPFLKSSMAFSAVCLLGKMAKVVEPLPDIKVTSAPEAFNVVWNNRKIGNFSRTGLSRLLKKNIEARFKSFPLRADTSSFALPAWPFKRSGDCWRAL